MTEPPLYNMPPNAGESYVEPLVKWLQDETGTQVTYRELANKRWEVVASGGRGPPSTQTVYSWSQVVGIVRGIVVAQYYLLRKDDPSYQEEVAEAPPEDEPKP